MIIKLKELRKTENKNTATSYRGNARRTNCYVGNILKNKKPYRVCIEKVDNNLSMIAKSYLNKHVVTRNTSYINRKESYCN
ncbi:hypothetical protein AQUCO_06700025v1 [Aquilegia coerulea]|uniref:Uncharacterized protein n=1 Tax=Aquilegia coerulea TaxID=218851 RepID=A0A2G5CBS9_AQUCA|nr:hypothetical protein AQUCO_06700025v1 [Aquilegia coerulea]